MSPETFDPIRRADRALVETEILPGDLDEEAMAFGDPLLDGLLRHSQ